MWDLFISHASEDKADVARPLAEMLQAKGYKVWFDEFTLTLGDNLRRKIEQGLAQSQFAVVVLSPSFFAKKWTNLELDGLFALERLGEKRILPVWHNVTAGDVESYSSIMAMRLGVSTSKGLQHLVDQIEAAVQRERSPSSDATPVPTLALHPHSIELLVAARDGDGAILATPYMGGLSVSAGGKQFGVDGDPRNEALNLHCIDELVSLGLAEQSSESMYDVTQEGYDFEVPTGVQQAPTPVVPQFTPANYETVKEVMKSAVAGNGIVMLTSYMGGDTLSAGGNAWPSGGEQRKVARWKSVLRELVGKGLLLEHLNDNYQVSHSGYVWTDTLNAAEASEPPGATAL